MTNMKAANKYSVYLPYSPAVSCNINLLCSAQNKWWKPLEGRGVETSCPRREDSFAGIKGIGLCTTGNTHVQLENVFGDDFWHNSRHAQTFWYVASHLLLLLMSAVISVSQPAATTRTFVANCSVSLDELLVQRMLSVETKRCDEKLLFSWAWQMRCFQSVSARAIFQWFSQERTA